jgi:hypothetical protein
MNKRKNNRAGGVAQGESPEYQPLYGKKKNYIQKVKMKTMEIMKILFTLEFLMPDLISLLFITMLDAMSYTLNVIHISTESCQLGFL